MKKYLFGIFAIILAVGFSSFKSETKQKSDSFSTPYAFWYDTKDNGTKINHIVSTLAGMTKEQVLNETACQDDNVVPVCLVGSDNGFLQEDDDFPFLDESNRIRETEQ